MSVSDDEAGISQFAREVYVGLPETNEYPELLAERSIICPLSTQVDRVNTYCMKQIPGENS
jgi:hypothetical protein